MSNVARIYNQNHVPRKFTRDHRRVSMYIAWSYLAEAGETRLSWTTGSRR